MHLTSSLTARPAPHLPAVLLAVVYLAAVAVAVSVPGERAVAGLVVLAGLTARLVVRRRSTPAALAATTTAVDTVAEATPAAAPAPAA